MGLIHTYITEKSTSAKGNKMKTRSVLAKSKHDDNQNLNALFDMKVDTLPVVKAITVEIKIRAGRIKKINTDNLISFGLIFIPINSGILKGISIKPKEF
jgi:hypothetical protein